jgi:hypothetical protein
VRQQFRRSRPGSAVLPKEEAAMTRTRSRFARVAQCLAACAICLPPIEADAGPPAQDGQWHFAITPYLWLPTINTRLTFSLPPDQGGSIENQLGPQNLDFALLLNGEARLDNWAVFGDFIYLDLSSSGSRVTSVGGRDAVIVIPRERNVGTQSDLKGYTALLAGSYTVLRSESAIFDALAGVRFLHPDVAMDWSLDSTTTGNGFTLQRTGHVAANETLVDAVVGVRGRAWFGDGNRWFVSYYGDIGGGDSTLTWQAFAGLGYTWSWGEGLAGYRYLSYDQSEGKLVQDLSFKGPLVGVSWRF